MIRTHKRNNITLYTCDDPSQVLFAKEFPMLDQKQVTFCSMAYYENCYIQILTARGLVCGEIVLRIRKLKKDRRS